MIAVTRKNRLEFSVSGRLRTRGVFENHRTSFYFLELIFLFVCKLSIE
jgi:hypothetical protein